MILRQGAVYYGRSMPCCIRQQCIDSVIWRIIKKYFKAISRMKHCSISCGLVFYTPIRIQQPEPPIFVAMRLSGLDATLDCLNDDALANLPLIPEPELSLVIADTKGQLAEQVTPPDPTAEPRIELTPQGRQIVENPPKTTRETKQPTSTASTSRGKQRKQPKKAAMHSKQTTSVDSKEA